MEFMRVCIGRVIKVIILMAKFFLSLIAVYILLVGYLFLFQRSLIYFPDRSSPVIVNGVEEFTVTTSDGLSIKSWFVAPVQDAFGMNKVIVFFHGNAGHRGHRLGKAVLYVQQGYSVLLTDYRGYGGNAGHPSEEGFYKDARAQIDFLIKEKGYSQSDIVLYGESIGTGVSVQMAMEYTDVRAVVLESPFSSLLDVAADRYFFVPVRYLLKDRFLSSEKISGLKMPVLIVHGAQDRTIPYKFARKLYDVTNEPKEFVTLPEGGHNDLYAFGMSDHVIQFLSGVYSDKN